MRASEDLHDTDAFLLSANPLAGVLHAAGAGDKGLLIDLAAQRAPWDSEENGGGSVAADRTPENRF